MTVYLIRHAHALDSAEDAKRPLSRRGRDQVRSLAAFLKGSDLFQPAEFWHSPLVRAEETAGLLARGLRLDAPQIVKAELQPESDPWEVARAISAITGDVAMVGHEPHLSALATLLIVGHREFPVFIMKKCSALALEGAGGRWAVRWHVSPDLIQ